MTQSFYTHPLPAQVEIVKDRKDFVVEYCRGKNVLHVGCVGSGSVEQRLKDQSHLHLRIDRVARRVIGIDNNKQGLDALTNAGFENCTMLDIEKDRIDKNLIQGVEVVAVPEVLEHLSNPGLFLENIKQLNFPGDILISVPNAFSYRVYTLIKNNRLEFVHPDHRYYFSPTTLKTLLGAYGLSIAKQVLYYWPSDDAFGNAFEKLLDRCPYFAEGIICVVKDNRHMGGQDVDLSKWIKEGESYFQEADYDNARQAFEKVLQIDPENVEALNNLGVVAKSMNDKAGAVEYLSKALEIDPYYKEAVLNFAQLLKDLNLLQEAIPYLEEAIKRYPDDVEFKNLMGESKERSFPKDIQDNSNNIPWKICYSPGISHHGENARRLLDLHHYVPSLHKNEPVWFFGLYFDSDYHVLQTHQGKKIINWRGADTLRILDRSDRLDIIKNIEALHICQASHQKALLEKLGVKSIVRPMTNTPFYQIHLKPLPSNGSNILVYWRSGDDKYIQAPLFFEIASKCPDTKFHIVGQEDPDRFQKNGMDNILFHGYVSQQTLDELMDACNGTIRPWIWDGNPNIQTKMLLKGRYAAHSCQFEYVTQCATASEYIDWINDLKQVTQPNLKAREWWLSHLNNFDFLKLDFKPDYAQ